MPSERRVAWWQAGLLGGAASSLAMLVKVVGELPALIAGAAPWGELPGMVALVFGMGFACGCLAWAARGLSRRFGAVGDGLVGAIVMNAFFLMCTLAFDPAILARHPSGPALLFGLATALGTLGGVWTGRDLRREWGDGPR